MNVRQLIALLQLHPADALVVTPAEPFGFTHSIAPTPVSIRLLQLQVAGVSHCEADDPRGAGEVIQAVCVCPNGGVGWD